MTKGLRRRRHDFDDLLKALKPAEKRVLEQRLPTRKEPGCKYFSGDFKTALSANRNSKPDELPPKRRLRLHEAILEELTNMGNSDQGEQLMFSYLRKALWLRSRLLYRQAMVELVRAKEVTDEYDLTFYKPAINTHIQDLLRFMVDYSDFRETDLELQQPDFQEQQRQLYEQLSQESLLHDALFKFFWLKLELDDESPIERRQKLIAALQPLEDMLPFRAILSSASQSNLLSNIGSLYYIQGRYADSLRLVKETLHLKNKRLVTRSRDAAMDFLHLKMNLLLLHALMGNVEGVLAEADNWQAQAQAAGFHAEQERQTQFEIYLRKLQVATITENHTLAQATFAERDQLVILTQTPLINQQYLNLFEANAMAMMGRLRPALKHLTHYQADDAKPDSLLAVYIGLLRLGCKLQLKEYDSFELILRDMRRPLQVLSADAYFAGLSELFSEHLKTPDSLATAWAQYDNTHHSAYYARLCRLNSVGSHLASTAAATLR